MILNDDLCGSILPVESNAAGPHGMQDKQRSRFKKYCIGREYWMRGFWSFGTAANQV